MHSEGAHGPLAGTYDAPGSDPVASGQVLESKQRGGPPVETPGKPGNPPGKPPDVPKGGFEDSA